MTDISIHQYLPDAQRYLLDAKPGGVPGWSAERAFTILPLAQGEYNMNFKVIQNEVTWVLRINTGSQMGLTLPEQITYEYRTLACLMPTGVAPIPYFLDNSCKRIPFGVLGMQYLAGEKLDYQRDLTAAAQLLARYHQLRAPMDVLHLVREDNPLSLTYERCLKMLQVYFDSDLANPELSRYLREVVSWADGARQQEVYFQADPWQCIINTEVNNQNWIVNRTEDTIHLVDWEKPLWGDPSQDLSHFRVPTTTLWKTNHRLSPSEKSAMMQAYQNAMPDPHLRDTIEERTRLRDPFNCLRGVSWCAMAWVKYQKNSHLLKNQDTRQKLDLYVDPAFVRSLFDSHLKSAR